jgi:peroxiredoxin
MTRTRTVAVAAMMLLILSGLAQAARVGEPAPDFTGTDSHGKTVRLADLKGKFVVLEWHNDGCPYVGKHYGSGNMQRLQREWTGKGVVWLTVISSAEGQQGYVTADQADVYFKEKNAAQSAVLLDPKGTIGRLYDARTTPHMFVIDPKGTLIYNGAIDDKPTTDRADIADATNYVSAALTEAMSGKPVTRSTSRPYGCSVKYGSTS